MATDTLTLAGTITNQGDPTPHPSGILTNAERKELGAGNAGRVVVQAPRVALTGGAQIASSTLGPGQGGVVQVTATDTLTLAGTSPEGIAVSGIFASAQGKELGAGNAGRVVVEAPRVVLTGGAGISSSTLGPGQGGAVRVTTAEALTLTGLNSGLRTTASESGPGGDLTVEARQVQLTKGAVISAESTGIGNAGSITIIVRDTFLSHHGTVTTEARQATGGNIRVTAASLVRLQDSQITATVRSGVGDGGNVIIDPALIVLQGSQITANAVAGHGGRASLTASQAFLADFNSAVTATSTRGINGEVNIQAPVTSLSGTVAPLPQSFTRAAELLRDRCAARLHEGTVSSSVERGRDGVPASPDGLLPRRLGGTRPARATPSTAGQRRRTMLVAQPGGLQRDATGQLQITHWPTMAASSQVYDVECAPR
jgi:large exoprotein involved in heme utilization and adhesion